MSDSDERPWLVGMLVTDWPEEMLSDVDHTTRGHTCSACGSEMWLADSGVKLVVEVGARPICNRCAPSLVPEDGDVDIQPPSDAVVANVNQTMAAYGLPPVTREQMMAVAMRQLRRKRKVDA